MNAVTSIVARSKAALAAALFMACAAACGGDEGGAPAPTLRAPAFGPVPPLPEAPDDPPSAAKDALGKYLFFDPRLSGSENTSCDACHLARTSFQDNISASAPDRSYPSGSPRLDRNTTSLLNIVYAPVLRWDGSLTDIVESMVLPFSEANMNLGGDVPSAQVKLAERLTKGAPAYVGLFKEAFGEDISELEPTLIWRLAGRALAVFARRAVSRDADFDRWNAGDDSAMSDAAARGFELFRGRARCSACHYGPLFTDFAFHNVSTSPPGPNGARPDEGRYLVTGDEADRGAFLTPTLRGVYFTVPYFHDGSRSTLRAVVEHFTSAAAIADPSHDPALDAPTSLTDEEVGDVIQFLRALRGEPAFDSNDVPPPGAP